MTTKKQLKEIAKVEKKVSKVCDAKKGGVIFDEVTGIPYVESEIKPKKTVEVTRNDDGVIINKKTGKPHFTELEKKSRDIAIALGFGKTAPSLKSQIEQQGFVISKDYLQGAEEIRADLHELNRVGILKEKELWKFFSRLSKKICKVIVASELKDGEVAVHKETIIG
jgi:hypothetical protein